MNGRPADDPRRTYVEFTLEPAGSGTRLTVVETGFAQLTGDEYTKAYGGNDLPTRGQIATDPAKLSVEYFTIPGPLSRGYTYNPYADAAAKG